MQARKIFRQRKAEFICQFNFRVYSEFGLTVFLQQLDRWLRHTPEKECLTVLDFVAQEPS